MGKHWTFGLLSGGAVAICGASAALAISSVLPDHPERSKETLFTVVAVTGLSTIAMILYPVFFAAFGMDDQETGITIGATIHDVAQVVGAGYAVSDLAGDTATFVKLLRVSLLPVTLIVIVLVLNRREGGKVRSIPWFVVLFAILAVIANLGLLPEAVLEVLSTISRWLLVIAISALGVKTSLKYMLSLGPGHITHVVSTTVFLLVLALGLSHIL